VEDAPQPYLRNHHCVRFVVVLAQEETVKLFLTKSKVQRRTYSCAGCGGKVRLNVTEFAVGRGLGTWRCENGCPKRRFTVTRYTGSGAEQTKKSQEAFPVRRAIAVKVQLQGASHEKS
jgi:hypothetical protein